MRLMHRYSWPGQYASVANVTPIHSPPEPRPISERATNNAGRLVAVANITAPTAAVAMAVSRVVRVRPARTRHPAAANPSIIASGNVLASAPIMAGPAWCRAARMGRVGAITL
jgi:hypothetical protein